jgi:hypothetical protein
MITSLGDSRLMTQVALARSEEGAQESLELACLSFRSH